MEGTYDLPNKYPYFFVTTDLNRMGFSPQCRSLGIVLYFLKAYPDWYTILKAIDAESPIVIFIG